jgi:predicted PurR-regulated permease PerM
VILDDGFGRSVVRGAGMAVGVGLIVGLVALAIAAGHVLILMLVAVILASGLQPFIAWIRGHLPLGRGPTILLVYAAFLLVVVGMAVVIVPAAMSQLDRTIASLPPFFERAKEWAGTIRPPGLSRSIITLIDAAARTVQPPTASPPAPGQVVQVGLTLAESITTVLTLLTVVYFWLTEHARLQRYTLAFVPQHRRKRARDVWNAAETRLGMWVRGQLILMTTIGVGTATAYSLLGVPSALLLGLIAAIAEAIPIVGPLLGAIPAVLVAATVSPQLALAVAGVYLVLQLIEGNILVPLVMRNTTGISPFLVILSVLIGGAAGGFVGALLAVPIAAVGEVLIEGLQAREVPVAQDPTANERTDDESNAAGEPDTEAVDPPPTQRPASDPAG